MKNLSTLIDWIRYGASEFARHPLYFGHGTDNPLDEAAALVLGMLKLPFDLSSEYWQGRLTEAEKELLSEAFRRRIEENVPVAYLSQRALYSGVEFYVDERVLIPRSPMAELIDQNLAPYWQGEEPQRILDLCCGSGCLGILAKYHCPEAEVVLADIDPQALAVAQINLERAGMEDVGIETVCSDGFATIDGVFDWILCNPPYVEVGEMQEIAQEYHHEPLHALVSGEDGLDLSRQILAEAADYLSENGVLILEVGMSWPQLEAAYPEIGFDWVEFAHGGEGVFAVSRDELLAWRDAELLD